jgi:hypothetical protein
MKKFQLNIRNFRKEQEALKNLINDLNIKSNQTFQAIKNTGKEEQQKKLVFKISNYIFILSQAEQDSLINVKNTSTIKNVKITNTSINTNKSNWFYGKLTRGYAYFYI